ncbi:MAG: transketolase C-terminal domain-containing protein [Solirubrobacteraceae bacterium]
MSSAEATTPPQTQTRYMEAINRGLADALEEDERVVLIGIDVGAGGGIFTVTRGLHERFGPERILDAPISEMGYVGAAVGAAMTGLRPIVEIMFMDFLGVCLDPILNQASKLGYMTNGALTVPIVFRTQTGAGRSAGAQHSQSLEAMLAHIPGLKVLMPATVTDAHDLLLEAVRDPGPVVFVENRRLYAMRGELDADPLPLGRARIAARGDDVTVVTWGQSLRECLAAAGAASVSIEIIDLRSIVPLDMETVLASAQRTGRVLVVHEAVQDFGAGAEIAARTGHDLFDLLRTPVRRLATPAVPMPFNPALERSLLPSAQAIADAAQALVAEG